MKRRKLRVVSLLSSATEIVCALGAHDLLVGRSHECDFPETVKRLPALSRSLIDVHASSADIDREVRRRSRNALSIYEVSREALRALEPDIILTQTQCEVCAVSLSDVEYALSEELGFSPTIVSLNPNRLSDIWADIQRVGAVLGYDRAAEALSNALISRIEALRERVTGRAHRPVFAIEWIEPLMTAGNWMPEVISGAGGISLGGEAGKRSPYVSWIEVSRLSPEVILIFPCGFDLARTRRECKALNRVPIWRELEAVRNGEVYLIDGNRFCNRPGPRIVETAELIGEILHPGVVSFGFEALAWERLFPAR